jgi:hypothetical protein
LRGRNFPGSRFFLFELGHWHRLVDLYLPWQICRSRFLRPRYGSRSEQNTTAYNGGNSSAHAHQKNLLTVLAASTMALSHIGRILFGEKKSHLSWVVSSSLRFFILVVSGTDITVWVISALLAIGIGLSKYAKWKTRNKLVRDLAAMDPERREKMLSRMTPEIAMEARQELMRRFHIS